MMPHYIPYRSAHSQEYSRQRRGLEGTEHIFSANPRSLVLHPPSTLKKRIMCRDYHR